MKWEEERKLDMRLDITGTGERQSAGAWIGRRKGKNIIYLYCEDKRGYEEAGINLTAETARQFGEHLIKLATRSEVNERVFVPSNEDGAVMLAAKPGDVIMFARYGGIEIRLEETRMVIVKNGEIICEVE